MSGQAIIRSDDLRAENRYRILRTLRHEGPQTRAAVSELTGLSAAAVSTLISDLSDQGIVNSTPLSSTHRRGRPQANIALTSSAAVTATVSLTIDRMRVSVIDYSGATLMQDDSRLKTRSLTHNELIDTVQTQISNALAKLPGNTLRHIGIGFQGVIENESGNLMWSPILRISHVPIRRALGKKFNVSVSVNNDCHLIAEALYRAHHDVLGESFVTVLFSHGIGMGLYLDGRPFSGTRSSALEFGHMLYERDGARCRCGKRGCIEAYASDYGIDRCAREMAESSAPVGRVSNKRMQLIIDAARNDDGNANRAFAQAGRAIGQGLANVFTLLDPMPVALIGRSTEGFDLMSQGLAQTLKHSNQQVNNAEELIHCFSDEEPFLDVGLALVALTRVDRQFADMNMIESVEVV